MKGIFSGLEKLGLGKLEKVEVFEDASKKENDTQEAKKKAPAATEADFLFEKTYVCPVCDQEFHSKKIRTGKVKLLAADTDLRPKYQYVDCLKYAGTGKADTGTYLCKFQGASGHGQHLYL